MDWTPSPLLTGEQERIIETSRIPLSKNNRAEIRIEQVTLDGHAFAECRIWNKNHKGWRPTQHLIRIPMDELVEKVAEARQLFQQFSRITDSVKELTNTAQVELAERELESINTRMKEMATAAEVESSALTVMLKAAVTDLAKRR